MPAARAPGVRRCIASYQLSGEAPAGYALDVGVLSDGRTALVEVNDGYAIGFYGKVTPARADAYLRLLVARYEQLIGLRRRCTA